MVGLKGVSSQTLQPSNTDLLTQTLVLAQQPHIAVNLPFQTVKAEVYEPIARKLSFSLSQKSFNNLKSSILPKKWDRGDYYYNDENDGVPEALDR